MAGAVVAVKARLDAARENYEDLGGTLGLDSADMEAAALKLQGMNRARLAKRRVALRREEQRLAKLLHAMDDPDEKSHDEVHSFFWWCTLFLVAVVHRAQLP